jgi:hypothetical protein
MIAVRCETDFCAFCGTDGWQIPRYDREDQSPEES